MPSGQPPVGLLQGLGVGAVEPYYLNPEDVANVYTLLTGMVSVQSFTLLAQLVQVGVTLVLVFVIALRRL